jgi:hypothetical protein
MTYMCMCVSLTRARTCNHDISIVPERTHIMKKTNDELRVYPKEGPMPKASDAPLTLEPPVMVCGLVRCSKSWTTGDAVRDSPCRAVPWASLGRRWRWCPMRVTRKKTKMSSHGNALQKPNCRTPRAGFSGEQGFRRRLLSCGSVRVESQDRESHLAAEDVMSNVWYMSLSWRMR